MDDEQLWAQVMSFAKHDDRSWTDAFQRFLDWEIRERERLKNPIAHIIARFDLSRMPFPVSLQPVNVMDYGSRWFVRLRVRMCQPHHERSERRHDFDISRDMWADSEDLCIRFVRDMVYRSCCDFVRDSIVVKPKPGT